MNPRHVAAFTWTRHRWGQRRVWLMLLLICAAAYYGSYYRHSLNFRDEGGTEALVAQRLLAGERPFLDVVLGYNVLWFYPIVALFKFGGVNFLLLRAYCFALSTLTAVLGFTTILRAGGRAWLAFLVSLLLVLVPGMTFKNYMPLLAVANGCILLHFILAERRTWGWLALGGALLGVTYLIRIDVGLFCTILWFGALCLLALTRRHWPRALGGTLLLGGLVGLAHLPVYLDAQRRGFSAEFVNQYVGWPKMIVRSVAPLLHQPSPPALAPEKAGSVAPLSTSAKTSAPSSSETLQRKGWRDLFGAEKLEDRLLALLLYWPILTLGWIGLWALLQMGIAWRRREEAPFARSLGALLLVGAALTTFPQYFFFRPDSPHLSEFSPGMWVAAVGGALLLGHRRSWAAWLLALFIATQAGIYLRRMMPDRWTGTIAARQGRTFRFRAANGVDVMVSRRESEGLKELARLINLYSRPGDYLVAYPYHPTINVLADRPTYEKNVYIDNATGGPPWSAGAIRRLERYRPAVVALSDWDVNGTNASRFSVWAEEAKTWIQTHYTYQGTYLEFELYTREPAAPSTVP